MLIKFGFQDRVGFRINIFHVANMLNDVFDSSVVSVSCLLGDIFYGNKLVVRGFKVRNNAFGA